MLNLVTNQHGVFTYRKTISGKSLRISLQTKDNLEALQIVDQLNSILLVASLDNANQVRAIIGSVLAKLQPQFQKQRLNRVQSMLGVSFDFDDGELLSVIIERYIDGKLRSNLWTDKTHVIPITLIK